MAIIRSGNGYNRAHVSGDVRTIGLTMDDIGNAIINDLAIMYIYPKFQQLPLVMFRIVEIFLC